MESYTIENLTFAYPEQEHKVLDDISLSIEEGSFNVLAGSSGSGKTTFLRQLKPILAPHGQKRGNILFENQSIEKLTQREEASSIGYVLQSPENQIVTDKVWHELAFGLESLGFDTSTIRLRVAEMASFFGIQNWFYKEVSELSGGQKQILNLAAIMVMQPSVLILDEPTSQLDPIAATNFLETVKKINQELGTTIILTEHRLEEALPMADRVLIMDKGRIIADGYPKEVGELLKQQKHPMFKAMPIPMRIHASTTSELEMPITVREGRQWLDQYVVENAIKEIEENEPNKQREKIKPSVEIEGVWFKYEKDLPDIVKGPSLKAYPGELFALLGGNGTGKSTLLSLISGINRSYRGTVKINGQEIHNLSNEEKYRGLLGVLPQNPQTLFVKKTVREDLYEMFKGQKLQKEEQKSRVNHIVRLCQLEHLLEQHPYDLSGGEQQRAALAKVLLLAPKILLLDEPTKGMDAEFKQIFAGLLKRLQREGVTIFMVSHDIEFCADYADYCALFFDGSIVSEGQTKDFFSGNNFYTTAANRMSRHLLPKAITAEDVIQALGGDFPGKIKELYFDGSHNWNEEEEQIKLEEKRTTTFSFKRILAILLSFAVLVFTIRRGYPLVSDLVWDYFTDDIHSAYSLGEEVWTYVWLTILFVGSATVFIFSVFQKENKPSQQALQVPKEKRKLSKRTRVAALLILLLIPVTIFFGVYYLNDRKYYFISLLIIIQTMIPFAMVFEDRKPKARELVLIAVLCALGVAGRAAFFMLPQFKPVAAIVIISAIALGGESGFLVGAMTMLLSNIMYSQGPWTPWQMFAMGIIGFLAGIFFQKGFLRRDRLSLAIFGGIAVFIVYGGIMNPASVIMFQPNITWQMITAAYVTGAPFDLVHAAAAFFFLFIIGEPMLEKIDRIKVKYGLIH
jgi:energy-coupling factor transport system ATP-binding protein